MRPAVRAWAAAAAAALLFAACTNTNVTRISRPGRPESCAVDMFPDTKPPYPYTAIANARTECDPLRRQMCVEQLRREACLAGAEAVFGFKESRDEISMFIDATFAVKGLATPAAPAGGAAAACDPICSPGFACQGGHCVAQCNPPCQTGEICNNKRTCEPAQVSAPATPTAPVTATPPTTNPAGEPPAVTPVRAP